MTEKLKTIAQTLRGMGLTADGDLVAQAALKLESFESAFEAWKKANDVWKGRAEAAEAALLTLKTSKPPGRKTKAED